MRSSNYLESKTVLLPNTFFKYGNMVNLPTNVDWRKEGAVTQIKNQGQCVAAVEGINKIKAGKLMSLSEQKLVDCDVTSGNQECSGGYIYKALEFIAVVTYTKHLSS
ncbi:hypothetical protein IC582_011720 [Cucumis melo]|uniref:Peptidase C1A papain C-terminal domain-containing protein n=1 Tax=Cucumis melo TaxID=3656 RepID=A0A9I9CJ65_CUCME